MNSKVKINDELTIARFGYSSNSLLTGSHSKVCVECQNCHQIIYREFRNFDRFHVCPTVIGSQKRCYSCEEWKDTSSFNKNPKGNGGVAKLCRSCYNGHPAVKRLEKLRLEKRKECLNQDIDYFLKRKVYSIRNNSKRKKIDCNLDFMFLKHLWEMQLGKCYYSGIALTGSGRNNNFQLWDCPSLDRLDPSIGYVKTNVVWCAYCINSFKGSLNEFEFKEIIKNIKWNL